MTKKLMFKGTMDGVEVGPGLHCFANTLESRYDRPRRRQGDGPPCHAPSRIHVGGTRPKPQLLAEAETWQKPGPFGEAQRGIRASHTDMGCEHVLKAARRAIVPFYDQNGGRRLEAADEAKGTNCSRELAVGGGFARRD